MVGSGAGKRPGTRKIRLTPARLEKLLADEQAARRLPENELDAHRKRLRGFNNAVYGHPHPFLGGLVGGICCSHRWALDCAEAGWNWEKLYPVPSADGRHLPSVGEGGGRVGVGVGVGTDSGMPQRAICPRCGHGCPATYITSDGPCKDCQYETMPAEEVRKLPPSASVIDFHKLRVTKGRLYED